MASPLPLASARARWTSSVLQVGLVIAILVVIWGSLWAHLALEHRRIADDAVDDVEVRALGLEGAARYMIGGIDRALLSARDAWLAGQRGQQAAPAWARSLDGPDPLPLAVRDAAGHAVLQFGDRALPEAARVACAPGTTPPDRLDIGPPRHAGPGGDGPGGDGPGGDGPGGDGPGGASSNGEDGRFLSFSRPILDPDGTCIGTVTAAVTPTALGHASGAIANTHPRLLLVGLDGVVRASQPEALLSGQTLPDAVFHRLADGPAGSFHVDAMPVNDGPGTIAWRRLPDYPLLAVATIRDSDMYATYRADRIEDSLVGGGLSVLVLAAGALLLVVHARMNRSQDTLAATLDNMSQGLVMIDERRRMPVLNRRFVELLGIPEELARPNASFDEVLRWQIESGDLTYPAGGTRVARKLARRGGLDEMVPLYERSRPDGTEIEVRTTLLPNGSAVRTYTDITARKRTERALAAARDAAEAAGRARTDFLATISHEIRTPLNGIIGVAGLLLDMPAPEEHRRYLEIIRQCGDHLIVLINDVLDVTRLDAGRLELEELAFELPAMIRSAVDLLAAQAMAKGLALHCDFAEGLPAWVTGDPARLRQILLNLIGNALKFTEQGEVRVTASVIEAAPDRVRIAVAVSDTGIGIAPEACERLFEAFSQVDTSISRRFGGTGLGLALCRRLTAQMGGSIGVTSLPGQGSTFRFDVLLKPTPAPASATGRATPYMPRRRLRILVTEDNGTNRLVATRMLERLGHRADAVADGAEALPALRSVPYDLVLMDVMMPGMDGLTATRLIRAEPGAAGRTPIIGLTANTQPADEQACRDAGMNGFVTKPVTAERLAAAIEAATAEEMRTETSPPRPQDAPEEAAPVPLASALPAASPLQLLDGGFLGRLADDISPAGVIEALGLFREDAPARISVMRASLGRDPARVRREAHALAGASRNIGLDRLGHAAAALQHAVERAEPDPADVEALAALVDESLAALEGWEGSAVALT
ncbi:MAG: ATP-binding protein [Acetobacteraceae bacterium]|nr:ATP-binding protein [Acetobacteraceae bacterium]